MKRLFAGLLVAVGLVTSAMACYNDSDTSLTELRDNLDVMKAVSGRFTLYPDAYYEKRIEIQSAILKKDPNNLDAYDNISVAYDRIGKGDEALRLIREKRKHLANAPTLQLYSTEANEGTFLIVRWIRGHKPGDLTDALESEKHIALALKINPNAHFGREFAQLACIHAMIQCGKDVGWELKFADTLVTVADHDHLDRHKLRYGIAGMMVLGAAWQMPSMIQAIAKLVPEEEQVVALCASRLRNFKNLLHEEKRGKSVIDSFPVPDHSGVQYADQHYIYQEIIRGAERFQVHRQEWIAQQLAQGKHTDNDPDFWKGFKDEGEIDPKDLTRATWWTPYRRILEDIVLPGLIIGAILALPGYLVFRGIRGAIKRIRP
ncbi:MAG: hypothetical protein WCG75_01460 [Armatimonadota bacterium]